MCVFVGGTVGIHPIIIIILLSFFVSSVRASDVVTQLTDVRMRKRRQAAKEEKIEPKKKVAKEVGTTAIDGSSMLPVVSAKTWTNVIEKEPVNRVRLGSTFYDQDCIELAKALLGKTLVREIDGLRLAGRIVETEAYLGVKDSACHSYGGRKSHRNQAMFMTPGSLYVYLIYGMYYCTNISSKGQLCSWILFSL